MAAVTPVSSCSNPVSAQPMRSVQFGWAETWAARMPSITYWGMNSACSGKASRRTGLAQKESSNEWIGSR